MKTELMIFAILAMVVSSFLNAENAARVSDQLSATKLRIENAGEVYAKTQQVETIATNKALVKPNEG